MTKPSDRIAAREPRQLDLPRYAFLMCTPWSGSTLLSMLVTSLPRVLSFGDTYFLKGVSSLHHICTCGEPYHSCPLRTAIADRMRALGHTDFCWDGIAPAPMPRSRIRKLKSRRLFQSAHLNGIYQSIPAHLRARLFPAYGRLNRDLLRAFRDVASVDWYFDGSKNLNRYVFMDALFPPVRVVHMIRRPTDFLRHFLRQGETEKQIRQRFFGWLRYHRIAMLMRSRKPPTEHLLLRYEDLVENPDSQVRRIASLLEIQIPEDTDLADIQPERLHVNGNKMRRGFTGVSSGFDRGIEDMPDSIIRMVRHAARRHPWITETYPEFC